MRMMLTTALVLGFIPLSLADGKCGQMVWSQDFDKLDIAKQVIAQKGNAFPPIPNLPGDPECSDPPCGVLPEARHFDASWQHSSADNTGARVALTKALARTAFEPYNLLFGETGDVLSSSDKDSCVAYNFVSNRNSLVEEAGNQVLQLDFPKGCVGKECAMGARVDLDAAMADKGMPPLEQATLQYKFKFMDGFEFQKGGKLPGLCGGLCDTGCQPSNGLTGWSARHMWIQCIPEKWEQLLAPTEADKNCDAKLIAYPYHMNKVMKCGDEFTLTESKGALQPVPGVWHTLTSYIKMNTAGPIDAPASYKEDGTMRTWVDGKLVLEETNMLWRKYNNITINAFYLSTFFGGSDDTWASPKDQYIRYDDIMVKQGECKPETVLDQSSEDPYKYHKLPDTTVTQGTSSVGTFYGVSEKECWKKCVDMSDGSCKSAVHAMGVNPTSCHLLDSVAEHRLERIRMNVQATLLYPDTRREMGLPLLSWQTADGSTIDKSTPCPMMFGAPNGVFTWPSAGKLGRKKQCGGDAGWVAKNPTSPDNTCKGFLHCHFFDAKTSVCERTRDMITSPSNTCNRVGEGEQCGGDQAFMDKASSKGGICCADKLDCVYKSPTMSKCIKLPALADMDDPFGKPYGRPRAAAKSSKCGGSIEGTALSDQCAEGTYCEYNKPFFAKCAKPDADPIDFSSQPPIECGDVGTKCMGTQEFVLGLGVDGEGTQRRGVCCKEGLRCIFKEPFEGTCEDPNKFAPCDPVTGCGDGAVADPETALLKSGPQPDTRPRTIPSGKKCGGSPYGTTAATCGDKLYCNYQSSTFAKCVKAKKRENFASDPPHECGGVGAQCMGDKGFVAKLGVGRTGRCCEKGLSCVFQAPYVGLCADPYHYIYADAFPVPPAAERTSVEVDVPMDSPMDSPTSLPDENTDTSSSSPSKKAASEGWDTINPVKMAEAMDAKMAGKMEIPDTRGRTIEKNSKCGGSPTGTTADQCREGMFCQYQTPTYAKCVKDEPISMVDFQSEAPHECVAAGSQCMGDQTFLDNLAGENRKGVCCKDGLRCIFQSPYMGVCADPKGFMAWTETAATSTPDVGSTPEESTAGSDAGSPDTRPRGKAEHKKCGGSPSGTTAEQCLAGLYCQYLKPAFAKCTRMTTEPGDFQSDPPHECVGAGEQCMGDSAYLAILGAGRIGTCCKEGLSCIFKEPYMGICADPMKFV